MDLVTILQQTVSPGKIFESFCVLTSTVVYDIK